MTYREQIRSPQWIQFATAFKKAKGWRCEACGAAQSSTNELSVHHIYYMGGVMMWEHPEGLLECLCASCHKSRQTVHQTVLAGYAQSLNIRQQHQGKRKEKHKPTPEIREDSEPAPIQEAKSPFPPGHIPYPGYPDHCEKWAGVVRWFCGNWPLQGGYLSVAMFAGFDVDGQLELRFQNDDYSAATRLGRPMIEAALSEMCREVFPDFKGLYMWVLGKPLPAEAPSKFEKMRQLLS